MPIILSKETIETMYESAVDIMETTGVAFHSPDARDSFEKHGAKTNGKKVYIPASLLAKALDQMPRHDHKSSKKKELVAASPFSNSPMILDEASGQFRQGTINDTVKMYQLAETCDLYQSVNPGVVDPEGNDGEDKFIAQIAMMLKYSDKWPGLGFCATASNTKNGDVYTSAKKAIQLIKAIKQEEDIPVMSQGVCPVAPLSYGEDSLINIKVLVEEKQEVGIVPCTLSFMTGPETLMGIVIHDIAQALAGAVYVQLLEPGTAVTFSTSSTMTDMRTMQPSYGCPEYLYVQLMFYEVCRHFNLDCSVSGCLADGTQNNYQAGFESCLTAIAPYSMTDVDQIFCYPGHMAAFAGGSFNKMIFDEELIINCNRMLQGLDLSIDPDLKNKLEKSLDTKSFLTLGDVSLYRKEQRVSRIFDKKGIPSGETASKETIRIHAEKEIERRCAEYVLPERSKSQKKLLSKYLPTQCKY